MPRLITAYIMARNPCWGLAVDCIPAYFSLNTYPVTPVTVWSHGATHIEISKQGFNGRKKVRFGFHENRERPTPTPEGSMKVSTVATHIASSKQGFNGRAKVRFGFMSNRC
eukprot:1358500-Amorphochlora_amoeboformis.AAC.1